jgi:condensin-2 complex subunit G2
MLTCHSIMFNYLQLAVDGASPAVRLAALQGLTALLDCPLSHAVLRGILPGLRSALHDVNARVRLGFTQLLLRVRTVRSIRFVHVAPMDHIQVKLISITLVSVSTAAILVYSMRYCMLRLCARHTSCKIRCSL